MLIWWVVCLILCWGLYDWFVVLGVFCVVGWIFLMSWLLIFWGWVCVWLLVRFNFLVWLG